MVTSHILKLKYKIYEIREISSRVGPKELTDRHLDNLFHIFQ